MRSSLWFLVVLLAGSPASAFAAQVAGTAAAQVPAPASDVPVPGRPAINSPIPLLDPADTDVVMSESFMRAHPDLQYRLRGLGALQRGEDSQGADYLRMAARYADKLSQAFLAQLYWTGQGLPLDRALGYVWMDLAAERATPMLLADREKYWAALDEQERARALREGKAIYAEYGDKVAQPRLEAAMRRALKDDLRARGSNRSSQLEMCVGDWRIVDAHLICKRTVSSERYYQDRYWKPAAYWQWQEQQMRVPREDIQVGSPVQVKKGG